MLLKLAYLFGGARSAQCLGLNKRAAIGAKTLLPMASSTAKQIGKKLQGAVPGLQTEVSAAVAPKMLDKSVARQYLSVAGSKVPAAETATSKWYRQQLVRNLPKEDLLSLRPSKAPSLDLLSGQTLAKTVPPPRRNAFTLAPTIPPPARVPR